MLTIFLYRIKFPIKMASCQAKQLFNRISRKKRKTEVILIKVALGKIIPNNN